MEVSPQVEESPHDEVEEDLAERIQFISIRARVYMVNLAPKMLLWKKSPSDLTSSCRRWTRC